MMKKEYHDITSLIRKVKNDNTIQNECRILLTIPISRFFRNRELWHIISGRVLPELPAQYQNILHIWTAGCAAGEEVYSLKMLILWMEEKGIHLPRIIITATDLNEHTLKRTEKGIYIKSSVKEVPDPFISRYLNHQRKGNFYRIKNSLKTDISWKHHNINDNPPADNYDMVFARNNLLTYCSCKNQQKGLQNIERCLKPGGFLIIEKNEKLSEKLHYKFINQYHPCIFKFNKNVKPA